MFPSITQFIGGVDNILLLALAIILCTFIIEDVTIAVVGILAADGLVGVPLALISIYLGMCIGDTFLYALGAYARTHQKLAHYIDHDFTAPLRSWLLSQYAFKVYTGHFVPGLRFTTFAASGFFRLPLRTYVPMVILGGLTLLSILFYLSYWFGSVSSGWVSHIRWGILLIFLLFLFFIGRHNLNTYRAKRAVSTKGDSDILNI